MGKYRLQRINDEIVKEMARILRDIKDPRVTGSMTTVTGCDVSPDLKYAKIYFSFLDPVKTPEEAAEKRAEIKKGLVSAHGFIRRELAASLNLRVTPELTFVADTSAEYGSEINKILNEIKAEDEKRKKEENDE
ncbi:MAG: 30S ribosome-binding factor RbfA [Clostridia bacterium]|nr:30S ribosome-binding factor RbfA [Clostridia bacterium]